MNFGGDPGRDDYGLPPVDIDIPDDARELDRDVHAYYRELRAERRRRMARRLYAPLNRDGMVLPLLAGCLALTLLAGTLLTVLTTGQETITYGPGTPPAGRSTPGRGPSTGPARPAASGTVGTLLPDRIVLVGGRPQSLHALEGNVLVLALIPPRCRCWPDLQRVAQQAQHATADTYLVGTAAQQAQLRSLARLVGLNATHTVLDSHNTLLNTYHPSALTAIIVGADGRIAGIVIDPAHHARYRATLQQLAGGDFVAPGTKSLPRPARGGREFVTTVAVGG